MAAEFRIASPCSASWEQMAGDDRVRYCSQCNLQVFNLAAMSGREIAELRDAVDGRFCGRLYLRADGTALTRDCPVGFRSVVKRVSRVAGAALSIAGALNFTIPAFSQTNSGIAAAQVEGQEKNGNVSVTVTDQSGAVMPKASIELATRSDEQKFEGVTDSSGRFEFTGLTPGSYFLTFKHIGFRTQQLPVNLRQGDHLELKLELDIASTEMGVIVESFGVPTEPTAESVPDRIESHASSNVSAQPK